MNIKLTPRPMLSVVIPTYNRPEKVLRCAKAILAGTFTNFELIIVDQSTVVDQLDELLEDDRVVIWHLKTPGTSRARNHGIRMARAEYIAFTDDDTIPDASWLANIVAAFQAYPSAWGVYGRVVPYGDQPGHLCPATIESTQEAVYFGPQVPADALGGGNNMAFRRATFAFHGLFNERLGAGSSMPTAEDTELAYRFLYRGVPIVYTPHPTVEHDNWLTRDEFAAMMRKSMMGVGCVFGAYALRGDLFAAYTYARFSYYCLRNRMATGTRFGALRNLLRGTLCAPLYRFARREENLI